MSTHFFTSESVGMGHPDKVADQVSDSVLDAILAQDPMARVAVETLVTTGLCMVAGEITTTCYVDIAGTARETIREIGYTDPHLGFDCDTCAVLTSIHAQSPDISQGVTEGEGLHKEQGAGDQGIMFGFACDETDVYMPMPIMLAHRLVENLADLRKSGALKWLRPDCKSQVTVEYRNGRPARVHTIVVSTQHAPDVPYERLRKEIVEKLIRKTAPARMLDARTIYHINPTGRFVIGGPAGDTGVTGRKIIVDSYGGRGRHGGGAFSGKDPTKVDRSATYAARHCAKNIVAAGLARQAEVQLAYAIGVADPLAIYVDTQGTGAIPDKKIEAIVGRIFDFTPRGMIARLDLRRPIYRETARFGHFGRELPAFTWEKLDMVDALRRAARR